MKHFFNIEVASEVGVNAAIVFERMVFWIGLNKKAGKNFKDDTFWTYSTQADIAKEFEYFTVKQCRTAIDKLIEHEYIKTGNYNRHKYDRTRWFALTEKGERIIQKSKKVVPLRANGTDNGGETIPVVNKQIKIKGIDKERIEHIRKICGIS